MRTTSYITGGASLVKRLLEDDDDVIPDLDTDEFAPPRPTTPEMIAAMYRVPMSLANLLQYAPKDFAEKVYAGEDATWDLNDGTGEYDEWPKWNDEDEAWTLALLSAEIAYDPVSDNHFYVSLLEGDADGNWDIGEFWGTPGAYWGSPKHAELVREFSHRNKYESWARYFTWVSENGEDPLKQIRVPAELTEVQPQQWQFKIRKYGNNEAELVQVKCLDTGKVYTRDRLHPDIQQYLHFAHSNTSILNAEWTDIAEHQGFSPEDTTATITHEFKTGKGPEAWKVRDFLINAAHKSAREFTAAARRRGADKMSFVPSP